MNEILRGYLGQRVRPLIAPTAQMAKQVTERRGIPTQLDWGTSQVRRRCPRCLCLHQKNGDSPPAHSVFKAIRFLSSLAKQEIGQWKRAARVIDNIPPLADESFTEYLERWTAWYTALQPEWRRPPSASWPLLCERDMDGWDSLCCGGGNGIFDIVISLMWQYHYCPSDELDLVECVAEDVAWVLDEVLTTAMARDLMSGEKRKAAPAGRAKKQVRRS